MMTTYHSLGALLPALAAQIRGRLNQCALDRPQRPASSCMVRKNAYTLRERHYRHTPARRSNSSGRAATVHRCRSRGRLVGALALNLGVAAALHGQRAAEGRVALDVVIGVYLYGQTASTRSRA